MSPSGSDRDAAAYQDAVQEAPVPAVVEAEAQAQTPTAGLQEAPALQARDVQAAHERGDRESAPDDRLAKMMELLLGVSERLGRLEESQRSSHENSPVNGADERLVERALRSEHARRTRIDSLEEAMGVGTSGRARLRAPESPPRAQWARLQQGVATTPTQAHAVPPPQHIPWGGPAIARTPAPREMKLQIAKFTGKETYRGLGSGFYEWGQRFIRQIVLAQRAVGYDWAEDVKIEVLGNYLDGVAREYFDRQIARWCAEGEALVHVMNRMLEAFHTPVSSDQAVRMMSTKKRDDRSWIEHYLYLTAVCEAGKCPESAVLEYLVKSAPQEIKSMLLPRLNDQRLDYLKQAEELAHFAQKHERDVSAPRRPSQGTVNRLEDGTDSRTCYKCNQVGHIRANCPSKDGDQKEQANFVLAVQQADNTDRDNLWILDSGASKHLVNNPDILEDAVEVDIELTQPDGTPLKVHLKGSVTLTVTVSGKQHTVTLTDVFYSARLARSIISYGKLTRKGCTLEDDADGMFVVHKSDGARILPVYCRNDVLVVYATRARQEAVSDVIFSALMNTAAAASDEADVVRDTLVRLHERLGHLNYDTIERMARDSTSGIKLTDRARPTCLICARGKQTKNSQSKQDSGKNAPTDRIGGVVCSDLKGPMTPQDRNGNRYMVNFVCWLTNYVWIGLARTKDQAARLFKDFLVWFEKRFDCRVHVLRTDGDGEYRTIDLFCEANGVARQISEASNQASNGKAERMHRTIMNMSRCMIFESKLPLSFWGDAVKYAGYVLNRSPTRSNPMHKSPLEMLTGDPPSIAGIVVFGSLCTVRRDAGKRSLRERAQAGRIIGTDDVTKGYRVYLPKDRVVITTQHVQNITTLNDEQAQQLQRHLHLDNPPTDEEHGDGKEPGQTTPIAKPRGHRARRSRKKNKGSTAVEALPPEEINPERMRTRFMGTKRVPVGEVNVIVVTDPKSYKEAMRSADADKWKESMLEEIAALEKNETWELVAKPSGAKLLHTKWVYKTKLQANGSFERKKSRLVVCGNEQEFGIDYILTFSAVLDMITGKVILAMAAIWRVPARHGDVPNAYVKADKEAEVEIFLFVPDALEISDDILRSLGVRDRRGLALRLKKSLYGLKQAGRLWNLLLHKTLLKLGYTQCYTDSCLYYKHDAGGTTLVGVYVDDLLVTGTNNERIDQFFKEMQCLELKDLGVVSKFLGIRFEHDDDGWTMDQAQTIREIVEKSGLRDANPVKVPIGTDQEEGDDTLLPSGGSGTPELPTVQLFQSLVGSLLWVARCTRPDISFAVHRVTRRTHAPTAGDWKLAKKIVRYLKGTMEVKFKMRKTAVEGEGLRIAGYSDADFAADAADRKSVSGGVIRINGMTLGWICRKQNGVALSTMEAEFVAASHVTSEMLGVGELLNELGMQVELPMLLHVDNQAAIKQIVGEDSSGKAKHIDVRYKFVKDLAKKDLLKVEHCESRLMQADIVTKVLSAPRTLELRELIGLVG